MKTNQIALLCNASDVTDETCSLIARAINAQAWHVAARWGIRPWSIAYYRDAQLVPPEAERLWILESADVADALGYHDVDPHGEPYGRVFWHTIRDQGGSLLNGSMSLSVTCSHEAVEIMGDPSATIWGQMPDGRLTAWELCDAVEAESYVVRLTTGEEISVSNFVTPNWFNQGAPKPYDYLEKLDQPFTMLPGGYLILMAGGTVTNTFGAEYPEWRKGMKTGRARTARRNASSP